MVEAATWAPLRVEHIGPWRAGVSGGFTRRANSAVDLAEATGPSPHHAVELEALGAVEQLYASCGQPSILRVPTDASGHGPGPRLLQALDTRGYRTVSTTRVLARTADGAAAVPDGQVADGAVTVEVADRPDATWLAGWLGVKAAAGVDPGVARGILMGCTGGYLAARDGSEVLGVIRAARVGDWVALSCLAVAPGARRRGLGRVLTAAATRWGHQSGARRAFLQVEAANVAALALYDDLGFRSVDEYVYRER